MLSNSWHKKEKPLPTMIGLSGGATSLSSHNVKFTPESQAGKSGADHYWDLGYTGGTDQNGNYDMTSYGTVTLEQQIGNMPPGVSYCRQQTTDFNSGIKHDGEGLDISGTWCAEIYVYPTVRAGVGWDGAFMQWKSGSTYNTDFWPFWNSDSETRFDYCNADYNSRITEDTSWGDASPEFDTWNHIRLGRTGGTVEMQRRTWDGSDWSAVALVNTGSVTGGPGATGGNVTMLNSEGNTNDNYTGRGIKGYVGPCLFVAGSFRSGDPSPT